MGRLCVLALAMAAALWAVPVSAQSTDPKGGAYLVVDAASGAVLAAKDATQPWYPASLTKMMTAYMVFEALATGQLASDQKIPVSARAAAQPPSKIGLGRGTKVRVKLLLEALIVRSANDAAVALAEAISGGEASFATAMTRKAQALGMNQTVFANASGLPDPAQVTTARDLAVLARALMADFPDRFALFSKRQVTFNRVSRPTYMSWLGAYPGAEGIKTGFTCGSGYNLVGAAKRGERRLIGIVLGALTGGQRNARLRKLMDTGFKTDINALASLPRLEALPRTAGGIAPYVLAKGSCAVAPSPGTSTMAKGSLPGWGLVFGSFVSKAAANERIEANQAALKDVIRKGEPAVIARTSIATHRYSALLVGLEQDDAGSACKVLQSQGIYCLAVPPKLLNSPKSLWR